MTSQTPSDDRPDRPADAATPPQPPPPPAPSAPGSPPPAAEWGTAPQAPPPQAGWQGGPPPVQGSPMAPYGAAPMTDAQARQWALLAHLSAIAASFAFGLTFLGPLVIYLVKKDENPFVAEHAREALNFNIILTIIFYVSGFLAIFLIGIPILIAAAIAWLVLTIIAAVKANNGELYHYPATPRLIN
jgi:uncharacterized Tic20 family protein